MEQINNNKRLALATAAWCRSDRFMNLSHNHSLSEEEEEERREGGDDGIRSDIYPVTE